jgi:pimeloyl-ACP methyl ester carboxylesterase
MNRSRTLLPAALALLSLIACTDKHERIAFQPCAEDPKLQCGSLRVPLDYENPGGAGTDLSVIRAPATGPGKRAGVLFINPGGPGASGVDVVLRGVHAPIVARIREHFDIVSFDPRGSNRSGAIRCDIGAKIQPHQAAPADLPKLFEDFAHRIATACAQQNGAIVGSMSTNNIARDIDTLRRALGEKDIVYVGLSFGTELGAVYVSMFPQHVRRALLDAGIPPEFRDSYLEFTEEQAAAMERGLHRVDTLCRADSACPLAASGVIAALDTLIARVDAAPVPQPDGLVVDADLVRDVVAFSLYNEASWPAMVNGVHSALAGDYRFLLATPRIASIIKRATNTQVFEAFDAIHCNDFGTRRTAAEVLDIDRTSAAAYPHFYGKFYLAGEIMRCAAWPATQAPVIRNVGDTLGDRILLLGNDFDPATPLSWTRSLARALGVEANVVRYRGGGHGVSTIALPCMDDLIVDFLVNGSMPKPGTACAARPISFAAGE